jgi:hypothetical protein
MAEVKLSIVIEGGLNQETTLTVKVEGGEEVLPPDEIAESFPRFTRALAVAAEYLDQVGPFVAMLEKFVPAKKVEVDGSNH